MGPRSTAQYCHGDECHSVADSDYGSPVDLCPRREDPSTQAIIPYDAGQLTLKKANPGRVFPEPPPPAKSRNENAQEVQSKRSKHLEDEAQRTSEASDRDRNGNTDIADKQVNEQRITHDGSYKIDILQECKDHGFVEVLNCSFLFSFLSRRFSESLLRFSESLRRLSYLFSNPFRGLWEPQNWFFKRKRVSEKATGKGLESLPIDLQEITLRRLPLKAPTTAEDLNERDASWRSRGLSREGAFTALNFFIKHGEWQCTGMDLLTREWQRLPTLACLPRPDPNRFQEYLICGHEGLLCVNVSKSSQIAVLVVVNFFTGETKELPLLHYLRNPVLLHILVNSVTNSYKVIAAGSASSSKEKDLSRRIEVYDSRTSEWEIGSDLSGPEFGLNEHQVGVCVNGILYFVMFLNSDGKKGIVAFDIEKGKWLEDRTCEVPFSLFCNTLQLLESFGKLYLFSEQERDGVLEHCIHVLELGDPEDGKDLWQWNNVVRVKKFGGRGLLVYPEYTCVPFGIGKLCVFNTINRDGVVYDLDNGMQSEVLQPPPENQTDEKFFCLNPVSFTLAPNFASKP